MKTTIELDLKYFNVIPLEQQEIQETQGGFVLPLLILVGALIVGGMATCNAK